MFSVAIGVASRVRARHSAVFEILL
jgi:hypothetical protein